MSCYVKYSTAWKVLIHREKTLHKLLEVKHGQWGNQSQIVAFTEDSVNIFFVSGERGEKESV